MKNKFFKFLALSLAATLLPGTTVCADDSSDYVHVDVFGSVYYGTLAAAKDGKSSVFTAVPESDSQFTITGKWIPIHLHLLRTVQLLIQMVLLNPLNTTKPCIT